MFQSLNQEFSQLTSLLRKKVGVILGIFVSHELQNRGFLAE
jgi:cell division protein ZapA (FtsZ GTPase activity inhibitor)